MFWAFSKYTLIHLFCLNVAKSYTLFLEMIFSRIFFDFDQDIDIRLYLQFILISVEFDINYYLK